VIHKQQRWNKNRHLQFNSLLTVETDKMLWLTIVAFLY